MLPEVEAVSAAFLTGTTGLGKKDLHMLRQRIRYTATSVYAELTAACMWGVPERSVWLTCHRSGTHQEPPAASFETSAGSGVA